MANDIRRNWKKYSIPEPVMKAIEKEGFIKPTEIQKLVLPYAIRDRLDILGAAATGTGKTLAFGIPLISRVLSDKKKEIALYLKEHESNEIEEEEEVVEESEIDENDPECDLSPSESELEDAWNDSDLNPDCFIGVDPFQLKTQKSKPYEHIYGLVLTPTRELACQVSDHLKKACQFTDLKICTIFGGMSVEKQERVLNKKPEIVVVTPGRFWSFIQDENPHALSASKLSVLVIDEADRMLEKGHFAELDNLINWLSKNSNNRVLKTGPMEPRQTLVFSATLTFVHSSTNSSTKSLKKIHTKFTKSHKLKTFIQKLGMSEKPKIIDTTVEVSQLRQWRITCPNQADKDSRLLWFLRCHPGRTIVFVNSKNSVRRLASVLQTLGFSPKSLMADIAQKMRLKKLEAFSKTENSLLIASDIAARGLDIPRVDYVVHFDVAHTAETHLHRSGRTARATNAGHSVILTSAAEMARFNKLLYSLKKTEDDIGDIKIEQIDPYEAVVQLAREIESERHIEKAAKTSRSWFEKMAEKADIDLDGAEIAELKKDKSKNKREAVVQKIKIDTLNELLKKLDKADSTFVSPISRIDSKTMDQQSESAMDTVDQQSEAATETVDQQSESATETLGNANKKTKKRRNMNKSIDENKPKRNKKK